MLETAARLASRWIRRISGPQRMSSDDGVAETLRPCTRSQARAINPSAVRASAGKKATPVRAATLRPPSSPTTRAPKSSTRLASCSNRISSYSSGPYEASTSPGRTRGETSSPTVSADVPGRDVQAHHREHTPGRRRLVALLLEPPLEVGVRRQPAHAHRRPPPLDHQRRPPDRDRLAGQHRRALPRLQQVAAQARAVGAARVLDLQHGARRAGARGAARRSARRCARRRSRRARSTRCPPRAAGASRRGSPPSRSGGGRRPRRGARPPRAPSARRMRSRCGDEPSAISLSAA